MEITIEEMYDNFKYLQDNYSTLKEEHPKLMEAINMMSAMICMHMPEHDVYAFAYNKNDILEFMNTTVAVYSYDSKTDTLAVQIYARPKESIN